MKKISLVHIGRHLHLHLYHYLIFSYAAILMISFMISLTIYHRAYLTISKDAYLYQQTLLKQAQNTIDTFFSDIYDNLEYFCLNPQVTSLSKKNNFNAEDLFDAMQLRNELTTFRSKNKELDTCGVYFFNSNSLITDNKRYAQALIPYYLQSNGLPEDLFLQMSDLSGYLFTDSAAGPRLIFYRAIFNHSYNKNALIFISVEQSTLTQIINATDIAQNNYLYLLDDRNLLIPLAGNIPETFSLNYTDLKNNKYDNITIDGKTYLHEVIPSDSHHAFYGSCVDRKIFFSELTNFSCYYIGATILVFIFGMFLSRYFARKNYEPIKHMVQLLAQNKPAATEDAEIINYEKLEHGLMEIIQESQNINFKLKQHETVSNEEILAGFLQGLYPYEEDLEQLIAQNEHLKDIDHYYVVLFSFKNLKDSPFFKEQKNIQSYELIFFLFKNIVNEVILESPEGHGKGLCLLSENQLCLLLPAEYADHEPERFKKKLEDCINFIYNTFSVNTSIAVSARHQQWSEIADAYDEAMVSISHKNFWNDTIEDVIFFDTTVDHTPIPDSTALLTMIRKLTNNILIGNNLEALENINTLCDKFFYTDIRMQYYNQCQAFMMISIIMNSLSTSITAQNLSSVFSDFSTAYYDRLEKAKSLQDLKEILHEILSYIIDQKSKKDENLPVVIEEIKAFVQENYQNPNLNIAFISDYFELSSARIGQQFKKETGISLVHYIHTIRLEKAKTLLKNGMTLKDCTEHVGFSDVKTFIRIFKQYEGIIPQDNIKCFDRRKIQQKAGDVFTSPPLYFTPLTAGNTVHLKIPSIHSH